jgi:hypothetical protein
MSVLLKVLAARESKHFHGMDGEVPTFRHTVALRRVRRSASGKDL